MQVYICLAGTDRIQRAASELPVIMNTPSHKIRYLIILPAVLLAMDAFAERMYKWVDENGQIHYSNRLPPEVSRQERKIINEKGRVLKVYRAPKTAEEKAEAKRLAELEAEKEKLAKQRHIHDRSLLATYASEADMLMARDGKITSIETLIQLTNSRIDSMQERLLVLTDEAAEYERSGKPLPAGLLHQITNIREQIASNREFAANKRLEMEEITQKFDADIKRYRELTDESSDSSAKKKQLATVGGVRKP